MTVSYPRILVNDVNALHCTYEMTQLFQVEPEDADLNNEATSNRMSSFLNDALCSSCEGIMVKSLDADSGYAPSKRSDAWLKVYIVFETMY